MSRQTVVYVSEYMLECFTMECLFDVERELTVVTMHSEKSFNDNWNKFLERKAQGKYCCKECKRNLQYVSTVAQRTGIK